MNLALGQYDRYSITFRQLGRGHYTLLPNSPKWYSIQYRGVSAIGSELCRVISLDLREWMLNSINCARHRILFSVRNHFSLALLPWLPSLASGSSDPPKGRLRASRLAAWEQSTRHSANPVSSSEDCALHKSTTTYTDFSSELPENYVHLKNKIMNLKNKGYYQISNKDTSFFRKWRGGTESTPSNSCQMEC